MDAPAAVTRVANGRLSGDDSESDLGFLPTHLSRQCRSLIESYHDVHGYGCLPDILWKRRLGPMIERHQELGKYLRKASTTRSAKISNQNFAEIATAILSLEVLASSFAGWSAVYPDAAATARAILQQTAHGSHMPLMDFYLYPPKHMSAAAVAALAAPLRHESEYRDSLRPANGSHDKTNTRVATSIA
jgi:hypothetical protein